MKIETIGFIGSGRVTEFILEGFARQNGSRGITVMDVNGETAARLAARFPTVANGGADYELAARADVVILALHPQAVQAGCEAVAPFLRKDSIVVSLAPKAPLASLSRWLATDRVTRYLPNAATAEGKGYNPVSFGGGLSASDRESLRALLAPLGESPEIADEKVEDYALLDAMGPTYLWPLLDEMIQGGLRYGLTEAESALLVSRMASGCAEMIRGTGTDYARRMNMIPSKPMADIEPNLRALFREKLDAMRAKLRS